MINCVQVPEWLLSATAEGEIVSVNTNGEVIWHSGTWYNGIWEGGTWHGGTWNNGRWNGGTWKNGTWKYGWWKGVLKGPDFDPKTAN